MPQFFTRAFVFLVPCFYGMASGLVSKEFSECSEFFYKGIPPQGITATNYQPICQRYGNNYYYATLYDRKRYAALYSAYKVSSTEDKKASRPKGEDEVWFYEPQLEDMNKSPEMEPIISDKTTFQSQASLLDYKESSSYTKGHLAPSQHQGTSDGKKATFTLTNMLPQREGSNCGPWAHWETEILNKKRYCTGDMYVITGGIPFEQEINITVSIPEYMWSAYCCTAYGNNAPPNTFPTGAAVGRNNPNSTEDIVKKENKNYKGFDVKQMSLQDLMEILNKRLNVAITLFQGDCK